MLEGLQPQSQGVQSKAVLRICMAKTQEGEDRETKRKINQSQVRQEKQWGTEWLRSKPPVPFSHTTVCCQEAVPQDPGCKLPADNWLRMRSWMNMLWWQGLTHAQRCALSGQGRPVGRLCLGTKRWSPGCRKSLGPKPMHFPGRTGKKRSRSWHWLIHLNSPGMEPSFCPMLPQNMSTAPELRASAVVWMTTARRGAAPTRQLAGHLQRHNLAVATGKQTGEGLGKSSPLEQNKLSAGHSRFPCSLVKTFVCWVWPHARAKYHHLHRSMAEKSTKTKAVQCALVLEVLKRGLIRGQASGCPLTAVFTG